jgi:hypothetical protein
MLKPCEVAGRLGLKEWTIRLRINQRSERTRADANQNDAAKFE